MPNARRRARSGHPSRHLPPVPVIPERPSLGWLHTQPSAILIEMRAYLTEHERAGYDGTDDRLERIGKELARRDRLVVSGEDPGGD